MVSKDLATLSDSGLVLPHSYYFLLKYIDTRDNL
jgi:hypothetical protein